VSRSHRETRLVVVVVSNLVVPAIMDAGLGQLQVVGFVG
jgi:hypothetical protein